MSEQSSQQAKSEKTRKRKRRKRGRGCIPFLLLAFAAGIAFYLIAAPILDEWRKSQIRLDGGAPHLNPVETVYLQYVLTQRTADLYSAAASLIEPTVFEIVLGQGAGQIAQNLSTSGLLNDTELFLNYANYYGYDRQFEAGRFLIEPGTSVAELAEQLTNAQPFEITLRFLEGWRLEEMSQNFDLLDAPNLSTAEFLRLTQNPKPEWLTQYPALASLPPGASLEGYLFPDTYIFMPEASTSDVIEAMLQNFEDKITPDMRQAWGANGLTIHETITIASIVQREAVLTDEKPIIAGVFLNRVERGMKLEADPTVQYALGYSDAWGNYWKTPLFLDDLKVDHPWNTYVYQGIPPGPIASPGLDSFNAMAEPTDTEFLFFVAGCDPNKPSAHVFATNFDDHLFNVNQCR